MKNLFLILFALVAIPIGVAAQNPSVESLADKYSSKKGFTTIILMGPELEIADKLPNIGFTDMVDISKVMDGIQSIIIVSSEKPDEQFSKDVKRALGTNIYSTLLSASEDGQQVKIMLADTHNKKHKEMVILILGDEDNILVSIVGVYNVKKISKQEDKKSDG